MLAICISACSNFEDNTYNTILLAWLTYLMSYCVYIFPLIFYLSFQMHKILLPYFIALMITPTTHSLEGTLLVTLIWFSQMVSLIAVTHRCWSLTENSFITNAFSCYWYLNVSICLQCYKLEFSNIFLWSLF